MEVTLLGNDPGDEQWSMLLYGEQLLRALLILEEHRHRFRLLTPDTRRTLSWLRRLPLGRALSMYLSRYLEYPRHVRKARGDIFHILDHGNSWIIRYLDASRTLITCHDLIPLILHNQPDSFSPALSEKTYRHAVSGLGKARMIITNSMRTREDLLRYLGFDPQRVSVVPLGLSDDFRPPESEADVQKARRDFGLPSGMLLLHVGQNSFYKNIEGILRALRILLQKDPSIRLVRAGAPLRRKQLRLAHRLGVAERVVQLGTLRAERLRRLYRVADLLLFPSWYEGFGLPPLEAMASGLPVVVSNRGALPETVGDAGFLVEPDSPEQIAQAVERVLHDSAFRAILRERGIRRATQFRWETTARRTLEVYQMLAR